MKIPYYSLRPTFLKYGSHFRSLFLSQAHLRLQEETTFKNLHYGLRIKNTLHQLTLMKFVKSITLFNLLNYFFFPTFIFL